MKFWDNVGDPSYFAMPLPGCLCRVSFSRYLPSSLEVVEKPNKCKSFLAPTFLGETTPTLLRQIVSANYRPSFGTVWLSSVCWSSSAKPGNEIECRFYGRWVKTQFRFEAVCGPKFMLFWDDVADPSKLSTYLPDCLDYVSFGRYRPLKLPLSCEVVQKGGLGPPVCRGMRYPDFGHAFSNYTYFWPCRQIWLSSVQRAPRVADE